MSTMHPTARRVLLVSSLTLIAGCVKYRPAPIIPQQVQAEFMARSFSDNGLRKYVEESAPTIPSQWPATQDLYSLTLAAFYYIPELEIARARLEAARGAIITAGARPNPSIGLGGGYESLPSSPHLIRLPTIWTLETAGKRGRRILHASRLAEAAEIELAEAAWKVRARVRSALLQYMMASRARELVGLEEEGLRTELASMMYQRLTAGDISRPDAENSRVALDDARIALRAAEEKVATSRVALAASLGVPAGALDGITLVWPELDSPPPETAIAPAESQRAGLLHRYDIRRSLAEYAASEVHLQLEVANQYPNIQLEPGYSFDDGENKFTLVPVFTLPIFNRNQGPIAEAEARRKEAAAAFLAVQAKAIYEMENAVSAYLAARKELAVAESALADQDKRERATTRALQIGEVDRIALVGMRLQRVTATRSRLDALQRAQEAFGALENALQTPLPPDPALPPLPLTLQPRAHGMQNTP